MNIIFNRESSHQHMVDRCIELLDYTDKEKKKCKFYMADSKGIPIWTESNTIPIDSGTKETVPWTLSNFISYSNFKYPSKAKFYCVKQGKFVCISNTIANFFLELDDSDSESEVGDTTEFGDTSVKDSAANSPILISEL